MHMHMPPPPPTHTHTNAQVAGDLRELGPLASLLQVALEPPPPAAALPWCQDPQASLDATLLELLGAIMARALPGASSNPSVSGVPSPAPGLSLAQWSRLVGTTVVNHPGAMELVERSLERCLQVGGRGSALPAVQCTRPEESCCLGVR
jgi:hypothetical protein